MRKLLTAAVFLLAVCSYPSSTPHLDQATEIVAQLLREAAIPQPSISIYPPWQNVAPLRELVILHDPTLTNQVNGEKLVTTIERLIPGDSLLVGPGRWVLRRDKWAVDLRGRSDAPIWIQALDLAKKPTLTLPHFNQNVLNLGGETGKCEYVCFRGLEITGGDEGVKFYDCHDVWLHLCHVHHTTGTAIAANVVLWVNGKPTTPMHTHHCYVTNCEVNNTEGKGEGFYIGGNDASVIASFWVIAENNVHHTSGEQGDGIELKDGSHHCWILRNHVHCTQYPGILVGGTRDNGVNIVADNLVYGSGEAVLQVQGDAIVSGNVVLGFKDAAFVSHNHQERTDDLWVLRNTFVAIGNAMEIYSWNDRKNMRFEDNQVCSLTGLAGTFHGGSRGVVSSSNVARGKLINSPGGFTFDDEIAHYMEHGVQGFLRALVGAR